MGVSCGLWETKEISRLLILYLWTSVRNWVLHHITSRQISELLDKSPSIFSPKYFLRVGILWLNLLATKILYPISESSHRIFSSILLLSHLFPGITSSGTESPFYLDVWAFRYQLNFLSSFPLQLFSSNQYTDMPNHNSMETPDIFFWFIPWPEIQFFLSFYFLRVKKELRRGYSMMTMADQEQVSQDEMNLQWALWRRCDCVLLRVARDGITAYLLDWTVRTQDHHHYWFLYLYHHHHHHHRPYLPIRCSWFSFFILHISLHFKKL